MYNTDTEVVYSQEAVGICRRETVKKLSMKSADLTQKNIEKIAALFPNVITEARDENGKLKRVVDFDLLKQELSGIIVDGDKERYQLTWPGKKQAALNANTPIDKTLRPVKEASVNWDHTENLYIEGDNLEVLKLLQESYLNKIKCIYIDPPYNTGKDFIYKDDFKESTKAYLEESGQVDEEGNRLFQNTESNGRFHSNWLTMMYSRLKIARNLLREDGVIFISIDDHELSNLMNICGESGLFGERNFRNIILVRRYDKNLNRQFMAGGLPSLNVGAEYVLIYTKSENTKLQPVFKAASDERASKGYWKGFWNDADRPTMRYELLGVTPKTGQWKWKKEIADEAVRNYEEYLAKFSHLTLEEYWSKTGKSKKFIRRNPNGKGKNMGVEHWIPPVEGILRNSNWTDIFASKSIDVAVPFDNPKNSDMLVNLIKLSGAKDGDIILDFFSGSATTAHAVMQLNAEDGGNRKYIMVQLPEETDEKSEAYKAGYKNICEIGKERIRRAAEKIKEETGADIDYGFRVFRVDSSNMKDVYYTPDQLGQADLYELTSNIKEDRTGEDLLIQVMLECGLELSLPMETKPIDGITVHYVAGNSLVACFDEHVPESVIEQIAKDKPLRVVFRDSSFKDDSARINVEERFKMLSPATEIQVL